MREGVVGLIIGLAGLAVFIAVACYVLSKLRESRSKSTTPTAQESLATFGALYDKGVLTKAEFGAIKRSFAANLEAFGPAKDVDGAGVGSGADAAARDPEAEARARQLENLLRGER